MRWSRSSVCVLSGILLFQLGWLISIPAFGGIDEFDHAYRAASVARGHWSPPLKPLKNGPGDLIPVPSSLVRAAENRCSTLPYTKFGNCHGVARADRHGDVLVASTAARYNPIFAWLIGTASRPLDGSAALYAMRAMTILLCDVILLGAWAVVLKGPTGRWKRVAALTSITPVLLYATTNAAPNGLEMCAGLLMWCAGLALSRPDEARRNRLDLWLFTLATATVLTVHSTGPLWVACIIATLAMWPGTREGLTSVWRIHRPQFVASATIISLVAVADVLWSLSHSTNLNWESGVKIPPLSAATLWNALPLWVFQTIGAVPFRNEYVPTVVFAASLASFGTLIVLGVRRASWRQRCALFAICVVFFTVPTVLTILSYESLGLAWQGRYALPYACGLPLLCGWVLDDMRPTGAFVLLYEKAATLGFCLIQGVSIWSVVARERGQWPTAHSLEAPSDPLLLGLLTVATASICLGMWHLASSAREERQMQQEFVTEAAH